MVNKKRLYQHYLYCSDTSASNREYFKQYSNEMIEKFHPNSVLDIASNDGLFLSYFKNKSIDVLGIDPAKNIAQQATEKGISTIPEFFNETSAHTIFERQSTMALITCNNAFAHNSDLTQILKGVKILLAEGGSFVIEVSYAMNLLKDGLFDLIYHEHMHHHHINPLIEFFNANGLRIYDAEERLTHGGSIRIYACHKDAIIDQTSRLNDLLTNEQENFDAYLVEFVKRVQKAREGIVSLLSGLKKEGKTISILGFPAKATTLTHYFELDNNIITDIFDDNPLKIGRYSPGKQIKILPTSDIYTKRPDYLLVLSWNYADAMMKTHESIKEWGGKFIVPLPELRIVE
jgi:SAM-dependent methyltransferase